MAVEALEAATLAVVSEAVTSAAVLAVEVAVAFPAAAEVSAAAEQAESFSFYEAGIMSASFLGGII